MKPKHLLVKVTKDKNGKYSAEEKIRVHEEFLLKSDYSYWGSNHNLRAETINLMIDEDKNMKLKTYVLILFSNKEKTTDDYFEFKAELLSARRDKRTNKEILTHLPPLFRCNDHELWLKIKNIKKVSNNTDYLLNNYRTLRKRSLKKINMCSMARIKKVI